MILISRLSKNGTGEGRKGGIGCVCGGVVGGGGGWKGYEERELNLLLEERAVIWQKEYLAHLEHRSHRTQ